MDNRIATPDLMQGLRPAISALPESGIVEVVNYGRGRPGLMQLWIGEGDQPTPAFIGEAAHKAFLEGETFYTWQRGIPPLRQGIADYLNRSYGTEVDAERIFVTVGGMGAIMAALQAILDAGEEVAVLTPAWPNIKAAVDVLGGVARQVPMSLTDEGWQVDLDRLFDACGPKTKAIFVNSPGNPTGATLGRDELIRIRDFARSRGLWIIADEVYGRLTYDIDHAPSFLQIMEPDERLIVVNTFSKNWSMTGWRIGWVVASRQLGQVFENLIQFNTSGVASFLQFGALAAINSDETVEALRERCRIGRDIVCDALGEVPRVRFQKPPGAFYVFLSVDGEPDSRALAIRLIDEANVGLAPGSSFGQGGEGFLRLCFGGSHDLLRRAMERLVPALK